jgi:hypothetical protein
MIRVLAAAERNTKSAADVDAANGKRQHCSNFKVQCPRLQTTKLEKQKVNHDKGYRILRHCFGYQGIGA